MIQIGASGFVQNVLCTGFTKCSFQRFSVVFSCQNTHDKPGFSDLHRKRAAGDGGLTIQCIDGVSAVTFDIVHSIPPPLAGTLSRYSKEISSEFLPQKLAVLTSSCIKRFILSFKVSFAVRLK